MPPHAWSDNSSRARGYVADRNVLPESELRFDGDIFERIEQTVDRHNDEAPAGSGLLSGAGAV
ncbi:hypothetical protein ABZ957_36510 [Streptomyces sp. NPDC046316]|uniref:hypothetical protein n=1 Tax=unclassified Streptomyces TaxID=2593676 RepID=UPI0033D205E7